MGELTGIAYLQAELARRASRAKDFGHLWSDQQWEAHHFEVAQLEEWLSNEGG